MQCRIIVCRPLLLPTSLVFFAAADIFFPLSNVTKSAKLMPPHKHLALRSASDIPSVEKLVTRLWRKDIQKQVPCLKFRKCKSEQYACLLQSSSSRVRYYRDQISQEKDHNIIYCQFFFGGAWKWMHYCA